MIHLIVIYITCILQIERILFWYLKANNECCKLTGFSKRVTQQNSSLSETLSKSLCLLTLCCYKYLDFFRAAVLGWYDTVQILLVLKAFKYKIFQTMFLFSIFFNDLAYSTKWISKRNKMAPSSFYSSSLDVPTGTVIEYQVKQLRLVMTKSSQ